MKTYTVLPIILFICSAIMGCDHRQQPSDKANKVISSSAPPVDHTAWVGEWERRSWTEGANIDIKNIEGDSLTFSANAVSGGHTGETEGKAFINGNTATYIDKELKGAKLIMHLQGDSVIIMEEQLGENALAFGGMGVTFSGRFVNKKRLPKEEKQEDLLSLKLLNAQQDAAFRKLVDTSYQQFVNSTQLTEDRTGEKDLDPDLHATVFASGVRGLYTIMENIIMIDKQNNIWAAVINENEVHYFTNNKDYSNKLPNTIEEWRSRFNDHPVVYMSK